MPWPDKAHISISGNGLLGNQRTFLSPERIGHTHLHTFQLPSRIGVKQHGIWEIPSKQVVEYGNIPMFIVSLAEHAIKLVQQRKLDQVRVTEQGERVCIAMRVFADDENGSLGKTSGGTTTGHGVHQVFELKHAVIVLERNGSRYDIITAFPADLTFG